LTARGGAADLKRLEALARRHDDAAASLEQSTDYASPAYANLAQEVARLSPIARVHDALLASRSELSELRGLLSDGADSDAELRQLAADEAREVEAACEAHEVEAARVLQELDTASMPEDIVSGAVLEVRAGAGGDEAALFAKELFGMYQHYATMRSWTVELMGESEAPAGGIREASMLVRGKGALASLGRESGVHRVQRVPLTEKLGRVHTSTASVAVLTEAEEADVQIADGDLKIETCRASGAGGQHVNTTDSAVRIVHLPTGLVAQCQDERSQQQNKQKALRVLRSRILAFEEEKLAEARVSSRREQIGSNSRSERIRTYNFHDDRITDHRCGLTLHGMPRMFRGELLDEFAQGLRDMERDAGEAEAAAAGHRSV
jgi:peptide chain release factor 1